MDDQPIRTELDEALARWEAGDLSREDLARRFPDEDVAGLMRMFEELQIAASGSTPDPGKAWWAVRERLPLRSVRVGRTRLIVLPEEAENPRGEAAETRR